MSELIFLLLVNVTYLLLGVWVIHRSGGLRTGVPVKARRYRENERR